MEFRYNINKLTNVLSSHAVSNTVMNDVVTGNNKNVTSPAALFLLSGVLSVYVLNSSRLRSVYNWKFTSI